jgi:hypothetical protein
LVLNEWTPEDGDTLLFFDLDLSIVFRRIFVALLAFGFVSGLFGCPTRNTAVFVSWSSSPVFITRPFATLAGSTHDFS